MEKNQNPQLPNAENLLHDFDSLIAKVNSTDIDVVDALNSTNPLAKDEFISDPTLSVPNNTYENLDGDIAWDNIELLKSLREEVDRNSSFSDQERRAAQMSIDYNELKNVLLLATACYNANPSPENAAAHRSANEALYGRPDRDTFLAILNERLDKITERDLNEDEQREFAELKELLGPVERPESPRYRPCPESVTKFSEGVREYMKPILAHIPSDKDSFTPEETAEVIEQAFADFVPKDSLWQVSVEPGRTNINVNQNEKHLKLAEKRANGDMKRDELERILAHELGTHFLRALPYENSSIKMLRTGVPGYEAFEEGIAKAMENAIDGKYSDSGINHYVSIGLANFMNTDFRKTYEIQKRLIHLSTGKAQDSLAYNSVRRAFRGTDRLPNNKDLVYYNGAEAAWKYIEQNLDDPELFDHLFLNAKTDATNPEHERLAYEAHVGGLAT